MSVSAQTDVYTGEMLTQVFNAFNEGVVLVRIDGTIKEANDAFLQLFQVSREECVGRQLEYFIAHADRQRFREDFQLVLDKKTIRNVMNALRRDRSIFPAEINVCLARASSGKPQLIIGTIRDVTHRMQVQGQIEKTTRELTALMKSSTEIMRTVDLHQRLRVIAQAIQGLGWRRVLITLTDENLETTDIVSVGLTPEEEKYLWENRQPGRVWRERMGPNYDRFKIGEFYYLPWSDLFVRNHFKNGVVDSKIPKEEMVDWDPQDLLYAPLNLPGGRIEGRISIDDPLDGRRPSKESLAPLELFVHQAAVAIENAYLIRDLEVARNEVKGYADRLELKVEDRTREINELEKKYESVVENANDGISIVQDGVFVFINSKMAEMSGYPVEEWLGKDMMWLVTKEYREKYAGELAKLASKETIPKNAFPNTSSVHIETKDGKTLSLETSSTIIEYRGKQAILTFACDVTEKEKMEEQLENAQRLAVIGELAASVGHDLRNPLTGIKGAAYYLRMKLSSKMDEKSKEMLDIIDSDVQYSNKIVNDLLDFSRDIRLARTKTSVKTVVAATLAQMKIPRRVKILDMTEKAPEVLVDVGQMQRVLSNIVKNAVEAMPRGGRLEIKSERTDDSVKISFRDTGSGISKENMSRLGSPLFTTKAKGVGMGLAICKRITEAHGGSLSVESKEKVGTCVRVVLPIDDENSRREKRAGR